MDFSQPATWDGNVYEAAALVLSNLVLVPSMLVLVRRGDYAGGVIFLSTFIASVLYHTCRAGPFCLMELSWHVTADYIFVYRALVYSIVTTPFRNTRSLSDATVSAALVALLVDPVYAVILAHVPFHVQSFIGIAVPVAATAAYIGIESQYRRSGRRRPFFAHYGWAAAAAVLGLAAGAFMFLFDHDDYALAHTLWHVCAMCAAYCMVRAGVVN